MSKKEKLLFTLGGVVLLTLMIVLALVRNQDEKDGKERMLRTQIDELNAEIVTLQRDKENMQVEFDRRKEKVQEEFDQYKEKMQPYEQLSEIDRAIALEEARQKQAELDEIEALKKAEEEAIRVAEERKEYETGVTYDQLARTPDDFMRKLVKFSGKVVQVMEGEEEIHLRLAVDSNYDTILYCSYPAPIVESRILEGDKITILGVSKGLIGYQSTIGGRITIPAVNVRLIDQ